jgi:hypothetical protein
LCKVGAKAAYIQAQTGMHGNVHAVFAALLWMKRDPLQWIVTGNEIWAHHCEYANKCQSMEWKHMSLPRTKKFISVPCASKVILTLFWDFSGHILKRCQVHGQEVDSALYCAMLEEEMKPTVCSKCRRVADIQSCFALWHNLTSYGIIDC